MYIKYKKYFILQIGTLFCTTIFLLSCSEIYFSPWNCKTDGIGPCAQKGDSSLLSKKSVDILIALDNSPKGQELNPHIVSNFDELLECIEAVDWRVGVISGVEQKEPDKFGQLINVELSGQLSQYKFIASNLKNNEKMFSDTLSLKTGCDYPPYCSEGRLKPLSAAKSFIQYEGIYREDRKSFLRPNIPLTMILVSSADEKKKWGMGDVTKAQGALNSVYQYYDTDKFVAYSVVENKDTPTKTNCVRDSRNYINSGMDIAGKLSQVHFLTTFEPASLLASVVINGVSDKTFRNTGSQLIEFARKSGGEALNICKPVFGRALAYSILKNLGEEDRFPEECQKFKRPKNEPNLFL